MASNSRSQLLVSVPESYLSPGVVNAATPVLKKYSVSVEKGDLESVVPLVPMLQGLGEQAILSLEMTSRVHGTRLAAIRDAGRRRRELLSNFSKSLNSMTAADQDKARQALIGKVGQEKADAIIELLREPKNRQSSATMARVQAKEREIIAGFAVTLAVAAVRSRYYTIFSKARAQTESENNDRRQAGSQRVAELVQFGKEFDEVVSVAARSLFDELSAGGEETRVNAIVQNLMPTCEGHLAWAAAVLGSQSALTGLNPALLPPSLDVYMAVRKLVSLYAYVCHLRALGSQRWVDKDWFQGESAKAVQLSYETERPVGSVVDVNDMAAHVNSDMLVQFAGIVKNVRVVDDPTPQKYSTLFELVNGGGEVAVRAHRFRLTANALANGSYCKVHGRLSNDSGDGSIVLNIDRLSLEEQAKVSWLDYITHETRRFYARFPDNFNMDYLTAGT